MERAARRLSGMPRRRWRDAAARPAGTQHRGPSQGRRVGASPRDGGHGRQQTAGGHGSVKRQLADVAAPASKVERAAAPRDQGGQVREHGQLHLSSVNPWRLCWTLDAGPLSPCLAPMNRTRGVQASVHGAPESRRAPPLRAPRRRAVPRALGASCRFLTPCVPETLPASAASPVAARHRPFVFVIFFFPLTFQAELSWRWPLRISRAAARAPASFFRPAPPHLCQRSSTPHSVAVLSPGRLLCGLGSGVPALFFLDACLSVWPRLLHLATPKRLVFSASPPRPPLAILPPPLPPILVLRVAPAAHCWERNTPWAPAAPPTATAAAPPRP